MTDTAMQFLHVLFDDKPPNANILIWQNKTKKISTWFTDIDEAAEFAVKSQDCDTYVGCGVSATRLSASVRCKANEIAGIPGLWLDVDLLDPAHQKKNLPETIDQAMEIVNAFPVSPTIIVHSGHGIQCWWLFDKFCWFKDATEHTFMADLLNYFNQAMADVASTMHYALDKTYDLSRVMRIPGCLNHKHGTPKKVTLLRYYQGNHYPVSVLVDRLQFLIKDVLKDKATVPKIKSIHLIKTQATDGIVLDSEAEPPKNKLEALLEIDPKFKATWERNRKDFRDQSPSAYDMSLANFARIAGWSQQEGINLMIAFRRKHKLPQKLRTDYYRHTWQIAEEALAKQEGLEELGGVVTDARDRQLQGKSIGPDLIKQAKETLSRLLKIRIKRILRYLLDPVEYRLELEDGRSIHLGAVENLIEQSRFRRKIADVMSYLLPGFKAAEWHTIGQALLNISVDEKVGDDVSTLGIIESWIVSYLDYDNPVYTPGDALIMNKPFFFGACLYIFGEAFRRHVRRFCGEQLNPKEMGLLFKEYGLQSTHMNFQKVEGRGLTSRVVWYRSINEDALLRSYCDMDLLSEGKRMHEENRRISDVVS